MGCDITLFCEGYLKGKWINIDKWYRDDNCVSYMITEDQGFEYADLIDSNRDYGLFYLLAGVRGNEDEKSYSPISKPKGVPSNMDSLIKRYYENFCEMDFECENADFHDASYLTLRELKESGYGDILSLRGWVKEDEFNKAINSIKNGEKYQLNFIDVKCQDCNHKGLVLKEWDGYLNLNLTSMIERMEQLKMERNIKNDDEIRIVFWFDN